MSFVFTFTSPSRWLSRLKSHTLGAFKEALANCKTLEEFAAAIQGYISSEINEAIYMQDLPHLRTQRVNWYEATLEALEAAAMPSDVAAEMTAQSVNQDVESAGESDQSGELARGDRPTRSGQRSVVTQANKNGSIQTLGDYHCHASAWRKAIARPGLVSGR